MRAALLIGFAAIALTTGCRVSACVGSGCDTGRIDAAKAQGTIRSLVAAQTGAMVASVTCPSNIPEKRGATFTCTAIGADGTRAPVLVTQTDGKGNVHISAPTLLHTGTAAQQIATRLTAQFKVKVGVRCPDLVDAHAGTALTCVATDAAGSTRQVAVTVTDAQGGIRYRLR